MPLGQVRVVVIGQGQRLGRGVGQGVGRAVQGLGAGAVQPTAMTIVGDLFPAAERGKVQGYLASVWALSSVVGPTLGGLFSDYMSWRWIFLVNLPLGLLAAWMLWRRFDESPRERDPGRARPKVDVLGTVLLDPVSVSLGTIPSGSGQSRSASITVTNTTGAALSLSLEGSATFSADLDVITVGEGDIRVSSGKKKHGASGDDTIVKVPVGTIIKTQEGEVLADLLHDGDLHGLDGALQRIAQQAERAGKVIRSVHDFLRRRDQSREAVHPQALWEAVLPLVRMQARKSGTRIEVDGAEPGDRGRLVALQLSDGVPAQREVGQLGGLAEQLLHTVLADVDALAGFQSLEVEAGAGGVGAGEGARGGLVAERRQQPARRAGG